jgi:hypothetical protein
VIGPAKAGPYKWQLLQVASCPDAVELLRDLDVRYVVLHSRPMNGLADRVTTARASTRLRLITSAERHFLFENLT